MDKTDNTTSPSAAGAFFDTKLLTHAAFVLIHSGALLFVIKRSPVVHWPYLMAAISAVAIGLAGPRKGWFLALLQMVTLWTGYTFFTQTPLGNGQRELEAFNLYGAMVLTLVVSFVSSVLKRAKS